MLHVELVILMFKSDVKSILTLHRGAGKVGKKTLSPQGGRKGGCKKVQNQASGVHQNSDSLFSSNWNLHACYRLLCIMFTTRFPLSNMLQTNPQIIELVEYISSWQGVGFKIGINDCEWW